MVIISNCKVMAERVNNYEYDLDTLIEDLRSSIVKGEGLISHFKYPRALYSTLVDVSKLIGLSGVKSMIAGLVSSHVVRSYDSQHGSSNGSKSDSMNHILLMGKPGTGKTTTAGLIANVICAIGFLDPNMEMEGEDGTVGGGQNIGPPSLLPIQGPNARNEQILSTVASMYRTRIGVLEDEVMNLKSRMSEANDSIKDAHLKIVELHILISDVSNHVSGHVVGDSTKPSLRVMEDVEVSQFYPKVVEQLRLISEIRDEIDKSVLMTLVSKARLSIQPLPAPTSGSSSSEIVPEPEFKPVFIVAPRDMMVAGYIGQTAIKVKKRIREAAGGVLFIDEAYNMLNMGSGGSVESFSSEAISTLCGCMSKYNRNFVTIMAGYEEATLEMLRTNEGMQRRFGHVVCIGEYTIPEVGAIFVEQLKRLGLRLDSCIGLNNFIHANKSILGLNGGITNQLAASLHMIYSSDRYRAIIAGTANDENKGLITQAMLTCAMEIIEHNVETFRKTGNSPPPFMYQ